MEEWNDGFKKERDKFFAQYSIMRKLKEINIDSCKINVPCMLVCTSFLRKQESSTIAFFWIPAYAGMTD
jgi:hypothetical protein